MRREPPSPSACPPWAAMTAVGNDVCGAQKAEAMKAGFSVICVERRRSSGPLSKPGPGAAYAVGLGVESREAWRRGLRGRGQATLW